MLSFFRRFPLNSKASTIAERSKLGIYLTYPLISKLLTLLIKRTSEFIVCANVMQTTNGLLHYHLTTQTLRIKMSILLISTLCDTQIERMTWGGAVCCISYVSVMLSHVIDVTIDHSTRYLTTAK